MWYRAAADAVLVTHLLFVAFVAAGGALVLRWPRLARVHVPIALYGAFIEFAGFICPLTPLEKWLRQKGGEAGYQGDFIDHYVTSAIYPAGLTREMQIRLGILVLLVNALFYALLWRRSRTGAARANGSRSRRG